MNKVVERLELLPVRSRHIACATEAHGVARSVHCPRRGVPVSLEQCDGCVWCAAIPIHPDAWGAEVVCTAHVDRAHPQPLDPSLDLREAMLRTTVGELLAGPVTCVHPEMDLDTAIEILSRPDTKCVPVVDCDAKLVGILSEGDVVCEGSFDRGSEPLVPSRLGRGFHVEAPSGRTVADVMTPLVHALPEDAPLSFAVGLMAGAGLRQIPVVGTDGRVIGMFTANDALRWVAQAIGYVV